MEKLHLNTVPNVTVSQIIRYFSTSYTQSYLPYLKARNLKYVMMSLFLDHSMSSCECEASVISLSFHNSQKPPLLKSNGKVLVKLHSFVLGLDFSVILISNYLNLFVKPTDGNKTCNILSVLHTLQGIKLHMNCNRS